MPGPQRTHAALTVPHDHGPSLRLTEILGRLPYASNATVLARDDEGASWVYKPSSGEQPLWDFAWRTLAAREVLTYEVSEGMGIGIVPVTRLAEGPFGEGSAQLFVPEDTAFDPRPLLRAPPDPILWPFAVLDIVTNNADRKIGHVLKEVGSGTLWAIDNGLTFNTLPRLRTVLWGFAGRPLPPEMVEALIRLRAALDARVCRLIADLLTPREAEATIARVERLLRDPVHPYPPEDRPAIPWPVW